MARGALTRLEFLKGGLWLLTGGAMLACAPDSEEVRALDIPPGDDEGLDGAGGSSSGSFGEGGSGDGGAIGEGAGGSTGGSGMGGNGMGGSGMGGSPPTGPTCGDDPTATPDHPWHPPFMIPLADVQAGTDKSYSVPSPDHSHTITVTAADFAVLKSTGQLVLTSSTDSGHHHQVVITCTVV